MSDFLLDFRDAETRRKNAVAAASMLKFCDETRVDVLDRGWFTLVLTRVDDAGLWGPYECRSPKGNILIALAGRVAFDEPQWNAARAVEGSGGLACKAIFSLYRTGGAQALGTLNGNFVVIVHDETAGLCLLVTDRCGMYLAYGGEPPGQVMVYGSHPDVVASVLGENANLDMTSLAEFLRTSRLTFPYTYYRAIRGLSPGSVHTVRLQNGEARYESNRRYFEFNFNIDSRASEEDRAEALAEAFKNAIRRRTLPFLGTSGVGLSGGLDSRAILAAHNAQNGIRAFTLFDEENAEFKVARAIAGACGVEMVPLRRDPEYYANSAELGVRISGGTGCITCNHFLGIRQRLIRLDIRNMLTGCYCDYLLKGLALNTAEAKFSRTQRLADFQFDFYDGYSSLHTAYDEAVVNRLSSLFPESSKSRLSEEDWLEVERKRCFPLAYEQDLAQRVIPQRVMPWYLPIVDNDIISTYLTIPSRYKLNASLFKKMLTVLCPPELLRIADNNTGAPVNASPVSQTLHQYWTSLQNRISERIPGRMATAGSWPNWRHYLTRSQVLQSLWARPNPMAREIFIKILGKDPFQGTIADHTASDLVFFMRLFTQKLWLDQRISIRTEAPEAGPVRDLSSLVSAIPTARFPIRGY